jgi:hypothetical protein
MHPRARDQIDYSTTIMPKVFSSIGQRMNSFFIINEALHPHRFIQLLFHKVPGRKDLFDQSPEPAFLSLPGGVAWPHH